MQEWLSIFEKELQALRTRLYPSEQILHRACRYALEGRGKRMRPLLCLAAAEACGPLGSWERALPAALAIEMVHTYSLVHDDLPCMDDDDLRRGRPTTHKAFDVGTALLVGDALLTDSFRVLGEAAAYDDAQRLGMVLMMSQAAGGAGMVYGQALDVAWTGLSDFKTEDLDAIHSHKTGRLIEAACVLGAYAAGGTRLQRMHLLRFGTAVGLAFQIIDDLIDDAPETGKTPGKDKAIGKLTYVSVIGHEAARARAEQLTLEALEALAIFGPNAAKLRELADALLRRAY